MSETPYSSLSEEVRTKQHDGPISNDPTIIMKTGNATDLSIYAKGVKRSERMKDSEVKPGALKQQRLIAHYLLRGLTNHTRQVIEAYTSLLDLTC